MKTAADILAAAFDYNAPGPDADWTVEQLQAAVDHASPFVKVIATRGRKGGLKCLVYAGMDDPSGDGGWACEDPRVVWLKDTDGRLAPRVIAQRASRYLGVADVEVEVRFQNGRR